jgi:signal-transduction protein with cAMP-binding, CBS, and nucleotidyltransferase domain
MPVADYCRSDPCTASPHESIQDVAQRMDDLGVGSLVIVDADQCPVGIVTDRDVVLSAVRRRLDVGTTAVSKIMHQPVVTVTAGAPLAVAIRFMRQYSVRRIPVVDHRSGRLAGILTSDDVVQILADELSGAAELMRSQFPGDLPDGPARAPGPGEG